MNLEEKIYQNQIDKTKTFGWCKEGEERSNKKLS